MKLMAVVLGVCSAFAMSAWAQQPPQSAEKPSDGKVFEMRTYYALPGRLDALHARFRDHTTRLFEKHGMVNIGYWVPVDEKTGAPKSETLVYILAYPSLEARQKSWDAFRNDPEWKRVQSESEKSGKIVDKVESVFLKATDYSAIK